MITRQIIDEIYRKYSEAPAGVDNPDIAALFDETALHHDIMVDPEANTITFGSIGKDSPFKTLKIENIRAILTFERWAAIVMHSTILFLDRTSPRVAVHVKDL